MPDAVLLNLVLFLAATFAAAMVAGMAGFAFGLVAAAVWLHVLSPLQTTTLIVAFGLIVQGYSVWKLRHGLKPRRLWPFLLGGALGLPLGVELLRWLPAMEVRIAVGVFLVLFSLWSLARPALGKITAGGPGLAASCPPSGRACAAGPRTSNAPSSSPLVLPSSSARRSCWAAPAASRRTPCACS
jgi:uncharacterized membrane protein YfcA